MAERTGRCSNFGLCDKADARELIPAAASGELVCPECGRPLALVAGKRGGAAKGNLKTVLALAGGGLLLVGVLFGLLLWPEPDTGELAEQEQQQYDLQPPPGLEPPPEPPQEQVSDPPTRGQETVVQNRTPPAPRPRPRVDPPPSPQPVVVTPAPSYERPPTVVEPEPEPPRQMVAPTPPPGRLEPSLIQARLLSPISTRQSREGDQFTAKVESGAYQGAILTGRVTKLERKRKESRIAFQFETITLANQAIPIKADLRSVTNSQGLKGVDDEGNAVSTSSKKKAFILGAIGGAVGGTIGKLMGGNRGMAVGAGSGAAAGVILGLTVVTRAQELHFAPGAVFTLETSEGRQ